jgi:hypothetical protein
MDGLKVAVIICATGTPVAPAAGVVEITTGIFGMSVRPHPVTKPSNRNATIEIIRTVALGIKSPFWSSVVKWRWLATPSEIVSRSDSQEM